ncbi:peptidoglycan recognition protein family protein [Streptomyces rhizosphaerihabitans]|uniref:peptidoglycan recognition protein family protein n=1 Tax=Streptomyces rhizosphaerihabitans TaxID=1266770 RepID=UPI0028F70C53|nr:peptidoglycan recognition protein [Streptomyces rhizosphaerihabitans]
MPRPSIASRADWSADESISPEEPGYLPGGKIKAVVLHHTAGSNDYTCAEAPAIIRATYAYDVEQLTWKDIGYNFLVDKCGTIYEGRKGGVDRPVMGAHAYGFNSETTGIAIMGDYSSIAPSKESMASVARLAAWKLGQYGVDPTGTTTLTAGATGPNYYRQTWEAGTRMTLPTIHGHRDGYNTVCPGDAYYDLLPTIRTWAGGPVTGLTLNSVTGAAQSGTTVLTKAAVTLNWSATTPAALVKQYDVLVDGKVAATVPGTAASAKVNLAVGTHKVAVRGVHQSGRTATTSEATVVAETTAPVFSTKPNLALGAGTVNTTAVPLTLKWRATDTSGLKEVRLTAPVAKTYGPTVTSAAFTAKSAVATSWNMTAYDQVGNTASASVSGTLVILQETSATRSGTWTARSSTSYLGGKAYGSSTKNASLTWTFTGRSAALVVSRAATSGQVYVYADGKKTATVDLKSTTTKYRDAIWTDTWTTTAKHTVKIVVVGTSGRPTVTTDGLVYLK